MRATVLRDFFLEQATAAELAEDMVGTTVQTGFDTFRHRMADLNGDFAVEPAHLVALCDAVLAGELPPERLEEIAFGMIASDHFLWDTDTAAGDLIANVLFDWSAPEIKYALARSTVGKFRQWLLTGTKTLGRADAAVSLSPRRRTWRSRDPER